MFCTDLLNNTEVTAQNQTEHTSLKFIWDVYNYREVIGAHHVISTVESTVHYLPEFLFLAGMSKPRPICDS